jgi:hypothetical protein
VQNCGIKDSHKKRDRAYLARRRKEFRKEDTGLSYNTVILMRTAMIQVQKMRLLELKVQMLITIKTTL